MSLFFLSLMRCCLTHSTHYYCVNLREYRAQEFSHSCLCRNRFTKRGNCRSFMSPSSHTHTHTSKKGELQLVSSQEGCAPLHCSNCARSGPHDNTTTTTTTTTEYTQKQPHWRFQVLLCVSPLMGVNRQLRPA